MLKFPWTFSERRPDDQGIGHPLALAADADSVYWTNADGEVLRSPKSGGAVERIALGPPGSDALALDESWVYWGCHHEQLVLCAPRAGGEIRVVAAGQQGVWGLCADADEVYWACCGSASGRGQIVRLTRRGAAPKGESGGEIEVVQQGLDRPAWLLLDREFIYWSTARMVSGEIWRAPRAGGAPLRLAADLGQSKLVGLDATWLYFLSSYGDLERIKKSGGAVEPVSRGRCGSLIACCRVQGGSGGTLGIEKSTHRLIRFPADPGQAVERGPLLYGLLLTVDSERIYSVDRAGDVVALSVGDGTYQPLFTDPRPLTQIPFRDAPPLTHFPIGEEEPEGGPPWEDLIQIPESEFLGARTFLLEGESLYGAVKPEGGGSALKRWTAGSATAPELLACVPGKVHLLVADGEGFYLFLKEEGGLFRIPRAGGPPQRLADTGGLARRVALDATDLYVVRGSIEGSCAEGEGPARAALIRVPQDGGAAERITPDLVGLDHVAVDESHVYWAIHDDLGGGSIWRAPKRGGGASRILSEVLPRGLAVDADSVSWTDARWEALLRIPKASLDHAAPLELDPRAHVFARSEGCGDLTLCGATICWVSVEEETGYAVLFGCSRGGGRAWIVGSGGDIRIDQGAFLSASVTRPWTELPASVRIRRPARSSRSR